MLERKRRRAAAGSTGAERRRAKVDGGVALGGAPRQP